MHVDCKKKESEENVGVLVVLEGGVSVVYTKRGFLCEALNLLGDIGRFNLDLILGLGISPNFR